MTKYHSTGYDPKSFAKGAAKAERESDERSLRRIANALDIIVEILQKQVQGDQQLPSQTPTVVAQSENDDIVK